MWVAPGDEEGLGPRKPPVLHGLCLELAPQHQPGTRRTAEVHSLQNGFSFVESPKLEHSWEVQFFRRSRSC